MTPHLLEIVARHNVRRGVLAEVAWSDAARGVVQDLRGVRTDAALDLAAAYHAVVVQTFPPNGIPLDVEARLHELNAACASVELAGQRLAAAMAEAVAPHALDPSPARDAAAAASPAQDAAWALNEQLAAANGRE